MDSIQKSEVVISKILTLLTQWGIQECSLEFKELELDPQEFGSFFFPCIYWLESEGIIRVTDIQRTLSSYHSGTVRGPVLTSKGLQVLGQRLPIEDADETMLSRVNKVSESGSNYSGIGDFFGGFLGGFTKSMSS